LLWILAIVFLMLWGVGLTTSFTLGGLVHVLPAASLLLFVLLLMQGRRRAT
jgi:F0F1-type ATP synthase assembly protein I